MKFASIRIKLAKMLVPPLKDNTPMEEYKTLPEELQQPLDAAVEANESVEQWQPKQSGNVIIVEPDLMREYRRGKL